MVPSTLRSGTAPFGSSLRQRHVNGARSVLARTDRFELTRPSTTPLRVSIWASCPIWMSLAWVSAILSSAFRN